MLGKDSSGASFQVESLTENQIFFCLDQVHSKYNWNLLTFSGPPFVYYNTADSKQMFNINFANDWILVLEVPFYQLIHIHCPNSIEFVAWS